MIKKAFIDWWKSVKKKDTYAIYCLASSEAWYQFEFGRYFQQKYCNSAKSVNDIIAEKDKVDITINGVQIECKMIWNNKNIRQAVESVIVDGRSIKRSPNGGYLALFIAFSNRHIDDSLQRTSYGNTCLGLPLQPDNKSDDFVKFAKNIWKEISREIKSKLKLKFKPLLLPKIEEQGLWQAAALWKVK